MLTVHQSHIALGCEVEIVLVTDASRKYAEQRMRSLWLTIFTFEKRCSRFLLQSELSQFNRTAGTRQQVSPEFRHVLQAALRMSDLTNGLYNPFTLPALQRAGYVQSMVAAHSSDPVDDFSDRSVVDAHQLIVGNNWAQIPFGTAIDLGGCGKGYIGDELANAIEKEPRIKGYYISLGGDIVAGGRDESGDRWTVGIENVFDAGHPVVGKVVIPRQNRLAIATSAVTARKGIKDGQSWHHVIDPRTGKPSRSSMLAATVIHGSALVADVLATCMLLGSRTEAISLAKTEQLSGLLLQTEDKQCFTWGDIDLAAGMSAINV